MFNKTIVFHRVAASIEELEFQDNKIATVTAGEKRVCITNFQGSWYGFAFKCPHASGQLGQGYVDAIGNVVCPVHRYRFNLRNGRNSEGYFLKTYPVEIREDGVYVGVEKMSIF